MAKERANHDKLASFVPGPHTLSLPSAHHLSQSGHRDEYLHYLSLSFLLIIDIRYTVFDLFFLTPAHKEIFTVLLIFSDVVNIYP